MRGLTAVPAPDGDGEVLLGSRAQPGIIERIDPSADYTVTTELDLREHSIPAGMNLRGTRAMVVSPFDNTTVYAGGGDIGKQISFNTAWIYTATIPAVASQKART